MVHVCWNPKFHWVQHGLKSQKQHNLGYVIEIQCVTVYVQVTCIFAHVIIIGTRKMAFVCSQSVLRVFFHSCASSIFWKYDNFIFVSSVVRRVSYYRLDPFHVWESQKYEHKFSIIQNFKYIYKDSKPN